MHGRVDLHGGPEQGVAADSYAADVEHHTVEVEEDALAQLDVGAAVTEEGRLHPHRVAAGAEQLDEDAATLVLVRFTSGVEVPTENASTLAPRDQLGIERIVQVASEHLLAFGGHD